MQECILSLSDHFCFLNSPQVLKGRKQSAEFIDKSGRPYVAVPLNLCTICCLTGGCRIASWAFGSTLARLACRFMQTDCFSSVRVFAAESCADECVSGIKKASEWVCGLLCANGRSRKCLCSGVAETPVECVSRGRCTYSPPSSWLQRRSSRRL